MGGSYVDVPGTRMAYDRDGTVGVTIDSANVISTLSTEQMQSLNDESRTSSIVGSGSSITYLGFVFPESRTLEAFFACLVSGTAGAMQTSTDTTNGLDGTWTTVTGQNPFTSSTVVIDDYRDSIQNITDITTVKGVRFNITSSACEFGSVHLYGTITAGETPNRLRIWRPLVASSGETTGDAEVDGAHFDFDNKARGTSSVIRFRVKNNSSTQTANSIDLSFEALTDSGDVVSLLDQFSFSTDDTTYSKTLNIGNLSAGSISSDIYFKRDTATNASLGLWAGRIVAKANSWS